MSANDDFGSFLKARKLEKIASKPLTPDEGPQGNPAAGLRFKKNALMSLGTQLDENASKFPAQNVTMDDVSPSRQFNAGAPSKDPIQR